MKTIIQYAIGSLALASALGVGIVTASSDYGLNSGFSGFHGYESEKDDDDRHASVGRFGFRGDAIPPALAGYSEECGACHFAYQPGLLPSASWERLMGGLEDHFGDNAELLPETHQRLLDYLTSHSADRRPVGRSAGFAASADAAPLRVSETRYFLRKHHEVPPRLAEGNPQVESWSRCNVCHTNAAQGSYDDDDVRIPGIGKWDD